MNLKMMIQPKKNRRFSIVKQTHTKTEETLESKLTKSRQTFHINPRLSIEASWRVGLITLEVYKSTFNLTEQNNKFQLCTDTLDEFSFEESKGELEDFVKISNISNEQLQDEKKAPFINSAYRKLQTEKHDYWLLHVNIGLCRITF